MNTGLIFEKQILVFNIVGKNFKIIKLNEEKHLREKMPFDFVVLRNYKKTICFDAKNTNSKTSFPFSNLKEHQNLALLEQDKWQNKSFIFIKFAKLNRYFWVPINYIFEFQKTSSKKSFKVEDIQNFEIDFNKFHLLLETI